MSQQLTPTQISQAYEAAEKRERNLLTLLDNKLTDFNLLAISDIRSMKCYDGIIMFNHNMGFAEVKIREVLDTDYPTAYLEKEKVDRLIAETKEVRQIRGASLYYIAGYPKSRTVYIFDLLNTLHTIQLNVLCPSNTVEDNGNRFKDMLAYRFEDALLKIEL